jgi:predicted MPP superfamily phosphohydrolase
MAFIAGAYGFFEARTIGLERITIRTSKVSTPLRIAQISDVHLGLIVGHDRLERIMARVKTAEPDILVSTGDLLDGQTDGIEPLAHLVSDFHPRYGSFAVTGNHEFHAGIDHALAFMRKAGFRVLRGETIQAGPITIAGVDDPGRYRGRWVKAGEMDFLTRHLYPGFVLLLRHRPTNDGTAPGTFDLQLSGHTHGGQIFPISLIARFFHQFFAGLYPLPRGSWLYVNRGVGTFGPPLRFLAAPEVTLIELIPIR